jgi:hypothetical protein
MESLSRQIGKLERKAERFDEAVERIMQLNEKVEAFEKGQFSQESLINSFKELINTYKTSSKQFTDKLQKDGFQEGVLEKYVDSTYNGEKILTVKATAEGEVFVKTQSGDHFIGEMGDDTNFMHSLDYIMCDIQFTDGLELIK